MVLEQHVTGLREERQRLQAEAEKVKGELKALEEQLERLDVALDALTGSGKTKKKKAVSGVKTHEVVTEIQTVLQAGALTEGDLAQHVAERLKAKGQTRTGLALRFKQALKHESFAKSGDTVILVSQSQV